MDLLCILGVIKPAGILSSPDSCKEKEAMNKGTHNIRCRILLLLFLFSLGISKQCNNNNNSRDMTLLIITFVMYFLQYWVLCQEEPRVMAEGHQQLVSFFSLWLL